MIYLDSSVVLAYLFGETRGPDAELFDAPVVSSRLLEYEIWNRLHARGWTPFYGEAVQTLLARVMIVELTPDVLERALTPFPVPVRTLDGLHLASIEHVRRERQSVSLATYDQRMQLAAAAMGIPLTAL